ncbi:DNA-directed RNA polymerase III subunit RPC5 [Lucilia cuprina]|uniref:DNA-directed RNA polymerase III subunit RPC5 n=1 Tax=Lucilia cuprina TaxID=7375 RepID=UPI001F06CCEB|nr:DNA-directed RNA polymerase III subunit RPC5 [Lucilia cuprina]
MEYENDEDEVLEEIPVFLSKNLQENLYLFQYPTKTQVSNFESAAVVNCCVKPLNHEVKVDFALDTESPFYDRFKGEQLALAADGKSQAKGERPTFKRGIMDKQAFVSSTSLDDVSKYIVGIYTDKEIHLSPLTSILQLRPSFSYFDKEDKRNKAEQKALNEEDDDEELQQVTVKFARTGGKKVKERQGYDTFVKKSVDEPWCETYWHSRTSPTAELERQKLFATNRQGSHALALDTPKYVEKLLPAEGQDQGIDAVLPARVISKAKLKSMNLMEQLKVILKDAKMLSFDDIMCILQESIDPKITAERVLRTLPQVGILIHGNWVPQSEILYPNETLSNANGVKSELMIRARDYVLFRFSRTNSLYRRQVIFATQLPPEEASEVLQSVAKLNADKKWELLLSPDTQFEQRYPDLVQRQEMVWRATEQTYNEMDYEKSPKRARKRSQRDSKTYSSTSLINSDPTTSSTTTSM